MRHLDWCTSAGPPQSRRHITSLSCHEQHTIDCLHAMQSRGYSVDSVSCHDVWVCDAHVCLAMQAGQLSQELRDKRAERAVARATANAYRQVHKADIGSVFASAL